MNSFLETGLGSIGRSPAVQSGSPTERHIITFSVFFTRCIRNRISFGCANASRPITRQE
jgi:hypothetical protein